MTLLNFKSYRILENHVIEVSGHEKYLNYNFGSGFFYYIEVFNDLSFKEHLFNQCIPKGIMKLLKFGKASLIVSNYLESFTTYVDSLYQLLVLKFEIPEDNIYLLSEARDLHFEVAKVAAKYNKKQIKCIWAPSAENIIRFEEILNPTIVNFNYSSYKKKFLNFNRRWRLHRPTFVSLLIASNLIDDGYVSLLQSESDGWSWEKNWNLILSSHLELNSILNQHKDKIISSGPHKIDRSDLNNYPLFPNLIQKNLIEFYKNTYFSIVSETYYYQSEPRSLSEKTFNTVVMRHPILLLSRPQSLELLKERGYRTFSPFINENYDNEFNDEKRMLMVLEETRRLCNLNNNELEKFVHGCNEICQYNYNHLIKNIKPYIKLN